MIPANMVGGAVAGATAAVFGATNSVPHGGGIVAVLAKKGEERLEMSDFAGLSTAHPWLALAMLLFMISLAGIPPTAGFMGKYFLFKEVLQTGINQGSSTYTVLVVLGVVNSVISVGYYLRIVVAMYMKPKTEEFEGGVARPAVLALAVVMFFTLHAGLFPQRYLRWSKKSSVTLDRHAPKQKLSIGNTFARKQLRLPLVKRPLSRR